MAINRTKPQDAIDEWIRASSVRGSFVDIGGIGEYSTNERVTFAAHCGYADVCVADFEGPDHHLWKFFKENVDPAIAGKIKYKYGLNVDDSKAMSDFGKWDFVHSTGILYHCPNPMFTLKNYRGITRKQLIVNTVIVPDKISNSKGVMSFGDASCLFMPALEGQEREILRQYYMEKFGWDINNVSPPSKKEDSIMPYLLDSGEYSYYPYWWLFSKRSFEAALELLNMKIVDTYTWENHAHFVWLSAEGRSSSISP